MPRRWKKHMANSKRRTTITGIPMPSTAAGCAILTMEIINHPSMVVARKSISIGNREFNLKKNDVP